MLNSDSREDEPEEDEIKDLPQGNNFQMNRGSPFKTSGISQ